MTDDEIEVVAQELAKIGGTSWYPGREEGSLMRVLSDRYRDRARIAIAALDRYRAGSQAPATDVPPEPALHSGPALPDDRFDIGTTVIYRPPGDRRAYACRVEEVEDGRVYLVPVSRQCTGWVAVGALAQGGTSPASDD
jgi:hypothetical protein